MDNQKEYNGFMLMTKPVLAVVIVGSLLILSFVGAALAGHTGGCLASDLQRAACVAGLTDAIRNAVFHSQMFLNLFVLTPVGTAVFTLLIVFGFFSLIQYFRPIVRQPVFSRLGLGFVDLPASEYRARRFLSLFEHSPTA